MKNILITLAVTLPTLIFWTPSFSQEVSEYQGILAVIQGFPNDVATQHSQCNQLVTKKSTINGKSLNPLCELCISLQDLGISTSYASVAGSEIGSNLAGSLSVCASFDSTQTLSDTFKSDFNLICTTRGGSFIAATLGPAVACDMTSTN